MQHAATWSGGMDQCSDYYQQQQNADVIVHPTTQEDYMKLQQEFGNEVVPNPPQMYNVPPPNWRYGPQQVTVLKNLMISYVDYYDELFSSFNGWINWIPENSVTNSSCQRSVQRFDDVV